MSYFEFLLDPTRNEHQQSSITLHKSQNQINNLVHQNGILLRFNYGMISKSKTFKI